MDVEITDAIYIISYPFVLVFLILANPVMLILEWLDPEIKRLYWE